MSKRASKRNRARTRSRSVAISAKRKTRSLVGADGLLPKAERLKPMPFLARLVLILQSAPREAVVDVAFDSVCRLHGYIPMKVLTFLLDEELAYLDDRHPHKVIGLTAAGRNIGASRRLEA